MSERIFRFNVGDQVTPVVEGTAFYGKCGVVDEQFTSNDKVLVNVIFDGSVLSCFREHHLRLVEPAPAVNKPKAPQPKFSVGDRVLIKSPASPMNGMACVVTATDAGIRSPYFVELKDLSRGSWFTADELEPAPTVNESLTPDNVNHPPHYNQGGIECIEAIKAALGDGFPDYLRGNVIKYLWRYKEKGGVEDLRKAAWYLDRLIKEMGNE
jgi:hypothetical protein